MAAPELYLFCAFDVDPLATALVTGPNCTFESSDGTLTDWGSNQGSSRVQSTDTCHAGTQSLKVTATAAGQAGAYHVVDYAAPAGVWLYGMCYLRPATTARSGTIQMHFFNAASTWIGAATFAFTETAGSWTLAATLAQAPANVDHVSVEVIWSGCANGEVHYLDTFSHDYLGTMLAGPGLRRLREFSGSRGAENEYEAVSAGEATFRLLDTTGNLSPDNPAAVSPYAGNIDTGRQVVFLARLPSGRLLPWFWGVSDSWAEEVVSPGTAWVTLRAVDAYRWLTAQEVLPPYQAEVMMDSPVAYLPLGEKDGATAVGSIVGDSAYAPLVFSRYGPAGTKFGSDPVLPALPTGRTADDNQTSVAWNPVDASGHGEVLNITTIPGALSTGPFTVEMWIVVNTVAPLSDQVLWRQARGDAANGLALVWRTDGSIHVFAGSGSLIAGPVLLDGLPHYLAVSYDGAGGVKFVVDSIYANGYYTAAASPYALAPDTATLGGAAQLSISNLGFLFRGRMAHFAIYDRVLGDDRLGAHWIVGYQGGSSGETEGNRFGGALNLVGWLPGRTRVDRGLSTLLGRSWSTSAALALLQEIARQGTARMSVDAAGKVLLRNRHHKVNKPVSATLSPLARRGWQPAKNDDHVVNKQRTTRLSGAATVAKDATSIARHGEHAGQDTELAIRSDAEAAGYGAWVVATRKDNTPKYPTLIFQAGARPALWAPLLLAELGDRVQVPGPRGTVDGYVEKVSWRTAATPRDVEFELALSARRVELHQMAQLDTGTGLSTLGDPLCRLGWY